MARKKQRKKKSPPLQVTLAPELVAKAEAYLRSPQGRERVLRMIVALATEKLLKTLREEKPK